MLPQFRSSTTPVSGTGPIQVPLPAGVQVDDFLLLHCESNSGDVVTLADDGGGTWTEYDLSPVIITDSTRLTAFWSRYNGTQGPITTNDPGDHVIGVMTAFSGLRTSAAPYEAEFADESTAEDTNLVINSITAEDQTTEPDCLVVVLLSCEYNPERTTAALSNWSVENSTATNVTERYDAATNAGGGGGLAMVTAELSTPGPVGDYLATAATQCIEAGLGFALVGAGETPVSATAVMHVEALAGVKAAAAAAVESVTVVRSVAASVLEALAGVRVAVEVSVESLMRSESEAAMGVEVLQGAAAEAELGVETLRRVARAAALSLESLEASEAAAVARVEALQGMAAEAELHLEAISEAVAVASTAVLHLEAVAGIRREEAVLLETVAALRATAALALESAQGVDATAPARLESLAGVSSAAPAGVESLSGVRRAVALGVEGLQRITATAVLWLEATGQAAFVSVVSLLGRRSGTVQVTGRASEDVALEGRSDGEVEIEGRR